MFTESTTQHTFAEPHRDHIAMEFPSLMLTQQDPERRRRGIYTPAKKLGTQTVCRMLFKIPIRPFDICKICAKDALGKSIASGIVRWNVSFGPRRAE